MLNQFAGNVALILRDFKNWSNHKELVLAIAEEFEYFEDQDMQEFLELAGVKQ